MCTVSIAVDFSIRAVFHNGRAVRNPGTSLDSRMEVIGIPSLQASSSSHLHCRVLVKEIATVLVDDGTLELMRDAALSQSLHMRRLVVFRKLALAPVLSGSLPYTGDTLEAQSTALHYGRRDATDLV